MEDLRKFDYERANQINMFDIIREPISIRNPIRLIELFAGYGSQAMALKRIGAKFEHYKVVEFDRYAIASYNAVHGTDFPTIDITKVHASDLEITNTKSFTYLLTRFRVRIFRSQEKEPECQKEVAQDPVCCGKLREFLLKFAKVVENYHRFYLWKTCHRCTVLTICRIFQNG